MGSSESLRKSWKSEGIDVVNNFRYSQVFRYSYGTLCKIEYLNGFSNSAIFGKPTWKTMNFSFLDNRLEIGDVVLCRISKYSNSTLGIGLDDDNLPIYNQYFLLTKAEENIAAVIPITTTPADTAGTLVQSDIEVMTAEVILTQAPGPIQPAFLPGLQENIITETALTNEALFETNIMTTINMTPVITMVRF